MNEPASYRRSGREVRLNLDNDRFVSVILSPVNMGESFLGHVLSATSRAKSKWIAEVGNSSSTVSHELRTPMTSSRLRRPAAAGAAGQVTDQQQRFLSTIKTNADRLSILVNEQMDISRVDRGVVSSTLVRRT